MKRLKVGVIGCGVMGGYHLKPYRNIPDVEVIGVSDIDPSRAPKDIKFFRDLKDLLDIIDAVSITTPTFTHFEVGMHAIEAGCSVMIEKPIALKTEQAEKLIRRAKAKSIVLAVGHIERFNPAYMAITKKLGKQKPDIIDIKRFSPYPERITDASCVIDMMIHDIDLSRKLAGSEIKYVNATGEKVRSDKLDRALAVLIFKNGVIANIEANRLHDGKVRKMTVIRGDIAYEADMLNKTARMIKSGESMAIKVEQFDQLNIELNDFVSAALKGKKPAVTGEDGLAALEIAQEIEKAAIGQC